ncbi:MAG: hypothetical protein IJI78_06620, partial [Oscillospiraceae bacterium]|nr:hypothetical protein [Oscillospiraceae bacterium]
KPVHIGPLGALPQSYYGFLGMCHCSYPSELFKQHATEPQIRANVRGYYDQNNAVLEALRVVNQDLLKASAPIKPATLVVGN